MSINLVRSLSKLFTNASPSPQEDASTHADETAGEPRCVDLSLMFDTTGSMYRYLKTVRAKLRQIAADVAVSHRNGRIGVIAFGDYCDAKRTYVVDHHPLTDDVDAIQRYVKKVRRTRGGDIPEAVEEALHTATGLDWRDHCPRVAVLVGDAPPHGVEDSRSKCENGHFYIKEAHALHHQQVVVYTVQCGNYAPTTTAFKKIAEITGGRHLPLERIDDLPEIIVAACKHRTGDLAGYIARLEKEGRSTGRLRRQLTTLED